MWWSLHFVAFGFFFKAVFVPSVNSTGHSPVMEFIWRKKYSVHCKLMGYHYQVNHCCSIVMNTECLKWLASDCKHQSIVYFLFKQWLWLCHLPYQLWSYFRLTIAIGLIWLVMPLPYLFLMMIMMMITSLIIFVHVLCNLSAKMLVIVSFCVTMCPVISRGMFGA